MGVQNSVADLAKNYTVHMNSGQTADCSVLVSYKYNILNFTFYSGMPLYHKKRGAEDHEIKI